MIGKSGLLMEKRAGVLVCEHYRVPYRLYGESDQVIVCVSGAKQTMSAWSSFVRYFKHEYSILLFDLPGQGRSQILKEGKEVPLSHQVDLIRRLCERLEVESYRSRYLIGGSWGSIVAAAFSADYPKVFDKLILGSFGTKPNCVLEGVIDTVQSYIEQGKGDEIAPLMIETFGQNISPSLKRQMLTQFKQMTLEQFEAFYQHSKTVRKLGDLKEHIELKEIQAPTLVVMGQCDTIMDLFDAKQAAARMQQAEFMVLPNVGHFLHWEQPSILKVYQDFFAKDQSGRRQSCVV